MSRLIIKNGYLLFSILIGFVGCKLNTNPYPVAPDFIAPHITTFDTLNDSLTILYRIQTNGNVSIWITKGIGPGENDNYLSDVGQGQYFTSKYQPIRVLVDKFEYGGSNRVVWDGRNENGEFVPEGYYRIYLRLSSFFEYIDIYYKRK